jgi:IS4 transposase
MDRGYNDYRLFGRWTEQEVYFVTRMKSNAAYRVIERREPPLNSGVLRDEIIELTVWKARQDCPHPLRRIHYRDPKTGHEFAFLTNHLHFGATTIARIYKDRWQIELFFKALKQNLKIKTFVGTSPNALRTQIWTALIAILLLKYL